MAAKYRSPLRQAQRPFALKGELRDSSEALWQEAYGLQPHDPVDLRMAERRRELASSMNEITALKAQVPENTAIRKATQDEAYAYWRKKSDQASAGGTAIAPT